MQLRRLLVGATVAATGALALGCSEEVEDRDLARLESYLKVSDFEGEWYYRQTVVEVPPHVAIGFTGLEAKLEKVTFEFREGELIARRVHEAIPGLEENEARPGATFRGDPVVQWPVGGYADIIRDFNRQTGEQSNVLVSDTSLRPWYERDYFEPDWNGQQLTGPVDFAGLFTLFSDYTYEDRPETEFYAFDPAADVVDPVNGYLQFTQVSAATDGGYTCAVDLGYWPNTTNTRNPCGPGEIKVRHSFHRIDKADEAQFEARPYLDRTHIEDPSTDGEYLRYISVSVADGNGGSQLVDMACTPEVLEELAPEFSEADCKRAKWDNAGRFGFFRTERYQYDRNVGGAHDELREFYANIHNVWQKVFETDDEGNLRRDDNGRPIAIPPSERRVRPIVYYLNVNYPEDLVSTAAQIGNDWNEAFMEAILAASGRARGDIEAELTEDYPELFGNGTGKAFLVARNTCSTEGISDYVARFPDMLDVVAEGTLPRDIRNLDDGSEKDRAVEAWLADEGRSSQPLERLTPGNIERVCAGLRFYSRDKGTDRFHYEQIGDVRRSFVYWVNEAQPAGPLGYGPSSPDPESGRIMSGNAYVYGQAVDSYARSATDVIMALNGDDDLYEIIDGETYKAWLQSNTTVASEQMELTQELSDLFSTRLGTFSIPGIDQLTDKWGNLDKAKMMRHLENRLLDPSSADPLSMPVLGENGRKDALIRALQDDPVMRARIIPEPIKAVAAKVYGGAQNAAEYEDEVTDLAIKMTVDPGALAEHRRKRAKFYMDRNIMLGEFIDDSVWGKALELQGLPREEIYQTLRREIFRGVMLHEIGHTVGLTHNFKGSFDALNYHDEYWDLRSRTDDRDELFRNKLPEYRYSSIMDYGARFNSDIQGLGRYDHAAIMYAYGGAQEVFTDADVPGNLPLELELGDPVKIPEMLGSPGDVSVIRARQDVLNETLLEERINGLKENAAKFVSNPSTEAGDYWRDRTVPYYYCADGFRGDLKCRTWDEGETAEEAVMSSIQRYWNYFIFNAYRRGRAEIPFINGYFSRQDRLGEYLEYPFKYVTFYDAYRHPDGSETFVGQDLKKAALMGMNFMVQVMGAPEPGRYCLANVGSAEQQELVYVPNFYFNLDSQRSCNAMNIPVGVGRDQYIDFNDEYDSKWEYMGSFYDKLYLIWGLYSDQTRFFRITNESDMRQFRISYYHAFQPELVDMMTDLMWGGLGIFANRSYHYEVENPGDDQVFKFPALVDPADFGISAEDTGEENTDPPLQVWSNVPYDLMRQNLILGAIFNSHTVDRRIDFIEYLTVTEIGAGEDRVYEADDEDVAVFTNPKNGTSYVAVQTEDGKSLAYDLLSEARDYVDSGEWSNDGLEFRLGLIQDLRWLRANVGYRQ